MSTTNVILTHITDLVGQVWANATVAYAIDGNGPFFQADGTELPAQYLKPQTIKLDASGSGSFTVVDSKTIVPINTLWKITINPNATAPGVTVYLFITGASQDISGFINAALAGLNINALAIPTAYSDNEIVTAINNGQIYFNTSSNTLRIFNAGLWAGVGGGGGTGSPAGPANAVQYNNSGIFGGDAGLLYSGGMLLIGSNVANGGFLFGNSDGPIGSNQNVFRAGPGSQSLAIDPAGNAGTIYFNIDKGTGGVQFSDGGVNANVASIKNGAGAFSSTLSVGALATLALLHVIGAAQLDSTLNVAGVVTAEGFVNSNPAIVSDVTATRALGTQYQNTSGRTMEVSGFAGNPSTSAYDVTCFKGMTSGALTSCYMTDIIGLPIAVDVELAFSMVVPQGAFYRVTSSTLTLSKWVETLY